VSSTGGLQSCRCASDDFVHSGDHPCAAATGNATAQTQEIKTDFRKGELSMVVTWLVSAAAEFCELGGCDF